MLPMYQASETLSTTMMKIGARLEESRSYFRRAEIDEDATLQKQRAWEEQWFGFLAEPIFETLMFTLQKRFLEFSDCLAVLKAWQEQGLDAHDFKLLVHLHVQLTDPFYRWATGDYFYSRYQEGFDDIPSPILARELNSHFDKELSAQSFIRLSQGILSTARDVGLLKGQKTKNFTQPLVSVAFVGYLVHTLQRFGLPMSHLPESPFARSVLKDENRLRALLREGQNMEWWEFSWDHGVFSLQTQANSLAAWFEGVET